MGAQGDSKSWHELPFWTLVKNYFACGIIGFIIAYILTRFANLDMLILELHMQNLWLLCPETFIVMGGLWIWNWSRKSENTKRKKQAQQQLKTLIEEAKGGEQKK